MVYTDNELRIYISDLKPEVQNRVLGMYGVFPDDKNLDAIINCQPLCIIPEATSPVHPKKKHSKKPPKFGDMQVPDTFPDI